MYEIFLSGLINKIEGFYGLTSMTPNGMCMKRSVLKDANFSDKHRAEFLYFVFTFFILKPNLKIWRSW